jgi:CRP/FNR family transcriptional regulator, nitrogen oxide reductase regulator
MIALALRSVPAFRDLDCAGLEEIAQYATERRLDPCEALFEQGESADNFYLVIEGRLKVTMITPEGKQVLVRVIHPGDLCGLALALARPDFPATCRALVAVRVLSWPMRYWEELIANHPSVAVGITRSLGRHITDVHARIAELATEEVEQRVAHAVLRLAGKAGAPVEGGVRIDFPLTRQDLAEMTGTTLHSVSRIVSGWASRGIVGRGRARLVVHDLPALERIARGEKA